MSFAKRFQGQKLPVYLVSCLMAFMGGHMINYSVIFLALSRFDSHSLAGLGYGLCFGPPLILGWFAGVYCDRYSPRRVILIAQNSYFIALAILAWSECVSPSTQAYLILLAALFSGIGWSFVAPARFATLPFYVKPAKLTGASIGLNLMVMTGFGLAPMLLKLIEFHFGWLSVFATSALLFVFSGLLLFPLRFKFHGKPAQKAFHEIQASLVLVNASSPLKALLLLASITYLLMGPMQVILPTLAQKQLHLSATAQGTYLSLVAFSLIAGGLLAMALKNAGKIGLLTLVALSLAGLGIGYLSVEQRLLFSVLVLIASSLFAGLGISFIVAGLQAYSSAAHRGRIMSLYSMVSQVIPAASGVGAGILAQAYSPTLALQVFSVLIVFSLLLCGCFMPHFRRLERFSHAL